MHCCTHMYRNNIKITRWWSVKYFFERVGHADTQSTFISSENQKVAFCVFVVSLIRNDLISFNSDAPLSTSYNSILTLGSFPVSCVV